MTSAAPTPTATPNNLINNQQQTINTQQRPPAHPQETPSAGVHISNDIDNPYKHTPANQGATGTNYGSYGEGHYDLTTGDSSATGGTWQHRTYQGTLRGYVVEMRMNPIYTSPIYKITDTAGATGDLSLGGTFTAGSDFTDDTSARP